MFGFGKILILAVIIAAVWYGFKFVGAFGRRQRAKNARREGNLKNAGDMVKCPMRHICRLGGAVNATDPNAPIEFLISESFLLIHCRCADMLPLLKTDRTGMLMASVTENSNQRPTFSR